MCCAAVANASSVRRFIGFGSRSKRPIRILRSTCGDHQADSQRATWHRTDSAALVGVSRQTGPGSTARIAPGGASSEGSELARAEVEGAEEVRDLERRRLRRVRAVYGVGLDRLGEVLADRSGRRLGRIGGAHQITPALDRVVGLQYPADARPLGHERAEALEDRPLLVHGVEPGGVVLAHADHPGGDDREAGLLDAGEDLAGRALGDGVRLDDGERAFGHDPITLATVAPMSAGLRTSAAPAAPSAFIFSAAVPLPPAMMAPAWPMRRPGGAVCPQMNATTGFFTCALL